MNQTEIAFLDEPRAGRAHPDGTTLYLDRSALPEAACVARLKVTREDRAMSLDGERLRQAIDRKPRVIVGLLQA